MAGGETTDLLLPKCSMSFCLPDAVGNFNCFHRLIIIIIIMAVTVMIVQLRMGK